VAFEVTGQGARYSLQALQVRSVLANYFNAAGRSLPHYLVVGTISGTISPLPSYQISY
jgi:hypothetical protein